MPNPSLHAAVLALTIALVPPTASVGADEGETPFAARVVVGDHELALRGTGQVNYLTFFEVYVGGLYLPDQVAADAVLDDVPKRLEFSYLRRVRSGQLRKAGRVFLERNLSGAQLAALQPRIDAINDLYEDVEAGDRYTLTYLPGQGTELALNGKRLGVIPGADFAAQYYAIWLGESPLSKKFKRAILAVDGASSS